MMPVKACLLIMAVKSSKFIESSGYVGGIICDYIGCIIYAYRGGGRKVTS